MNFIQLDQKKWRCLIRKNNIIIQNILNDICKIIADINKLQEDNFIEDLDYIKLYLEEAVNYKEIQAEKEVANND